RREHGLPCTNPVRPSMAATFSALPLRMSSSLSRSRSLAYARLLLGRLLLQTGDQDAVIQRVHLNRHLVLGLLQVVSRSRNLRRYDTVLRVNPDQLRERLREHGAAGHERVLALAQRESLRRNCR